MQAIQYGTAAILFIPIADIGATTAAVDLGQATVTNGIYVALCDVDIKRPIVVECVFQRGEQGVGLVLPIAPARREVVAARQVCQLATGVPDGNIGTPARAVGFVVFVLVTHAQGGGVGDIKLESGKRGPVTSTPARPVSQLP